MDDRKGEPIYVNTKTLPEVANSVNSVAFGWAMDLVVVVYMADKRPIVPDGAALAARLSGMFPKRPRTGCWI
jgi:hypothetical protein